MSKNIARCLSLLLAATFVLSCAPTTVAPESTATAVPTLEPTATAVPPTATPEPTVTSTPVPPTATPVPPTKTPEPTATPLPTNTPKPAPTKVVTPKPTVTKAPAISSGGGVSSQPSTVQKSIKQTFDTVQAMLGLLDQMPTGGVDLCAPLLAKYQGVINAPLYDVSGESASVQQAYDLYRSAISIISARSASFLDCGKSGGPIGGLDWGETRRIVDKSLGILGQAWQRLANMSDQTTLSPMSAAMARLRTSLEGIASAFDKHLGGWPTPLRGRDPECASVQAYHAAIQPQEIDVTGQPQSVANAYQSYREVLDQYNLKVSGVASMCANEDYTLNVSAMRYIRTDLQNIIRSLIAAQNSLGQ